MSNFFGSILWMIVSIGILVTIHEYGHYWVARRCGVKVLRFSIGFGKPLWSRKNKEGTEFAIAAIPLGGYVQMLGQNDADVTEGQNDTNPESFKNKHVLQRIAIVAAGPIMNLLLCVFLLWVMFLVGKQNYSPTIGRVEGIAATAGFQAGDRIMDIEGRPTPTFMDASMILTMAAMDKKDVQVHVQNEAGQKFTRILALSQLPAEFDQQQVPVLSGIAWNFQLLPAVIASTAKGSPAEKLLQAGDRIIAIDSKRVFWADEVFPLIQDLGKRGGAGMIEVERKGERFALSITPRESSRPERPNSWEIGIALDTQYRPTYDVLQRYNVFAAVPMALRETARLTRDSLGMIKRMLTGQASVKNISGPVTIARTANASAQRGIDWFIQFLALLSLSLAIMNLLPIPVLDGGHLLYYLIELIKGSPVSEQVMATGQFIGLALLASLMGLAFYNDILGLVS